MPYLRFSLTLEDTPSGVSGYPFYCSQVVLITLAKL